MTDPRIETADDAPRDLPESWGTPPGDPFSAERRNWIALQVAKARTLDGERRRRVDAANIVYGEAGRARDRGQSGLADRLVRMGDLLR